MDSRLHRRCNPSCKAASDRTPKVPVAEKAMTRAGIPVGMAMGDNEDTERLIRYLMGY